MTAATARADSGFTLLEILVAVIVLGLVLLATGQGLRLVVAASTAQSRATAAREAAGASERLLRGLIERMPPGVGQTANLRGLPDAVQFQTVLPLSTTGLKSRTVGAAIGVGAPGRLVLRLSQPPTESVEVTLIEDVVRLELRYFRRASTGPGGEWVGAWSEPDLPALVRFHLVFAAATGRHWPDIVVAPMRDRVAN